MGGRSLAYGGTFAEDEVNKVSEQLKNVNGLFSTCAYIGEYR